MKKKRTDLHCEERNKSQFEYTEFEVLEEQWKTCQLSNCVSKHGTQKIKNTDEKGLGGSKGRREKVKEGGRERTQRCCLKFVQNPGRKYRIL